MAQTYIIEIIDWQNPGMCIIIPLRLSHPLIIGKIMIS